MIRQPYLTKNRNRVPSVTTILGKFKDPGPLMYWSWNLAYEQLQIAVSLLDDTKPDTKHIRAFLKSNPLELGNFRAVSGRAADAGTLAHSLVEMWIHAQKGERIRLAKQTPEQLSSVYKVELDTAKKAAQSFAGFIDWACTYKLKVIGTEIRLVCEEFNFGGTIDCVAMVGTKGREQLVLLDWKTSKAVYGDYLCQIAAYGILWHEHNPEKPIESYQLVRFDKETGDYHHHAWTDLVEAEQMFLKLRECYDLESIVAKRAK